MQIEEYIFLYVNCLEGHFCYILMSVCTYVDICMHIQYVDMLHYYNEVIYGGVKFLMQNLTQMFNRFFHNFYTRFSYTYVYLHCTVYKFYYRETCRYVSPRSIHWVLHQLQNKKLKQQLTHEPSDVTSLLTDAVQILPKIFSNNNSIFFSVISFYKYIHCNVCNVNVYIKECVDVKTVINSS